MKYIPLSAPLVGLTVTVRPNTRTNSAVTDLAASMVTTHVLFPVQSPVHSENWYPSAGVATTVTAAPGLCDVSPDGSTVPPSGGLAATARNLAGKWGQPASGYTWGQQA